MNAGLKPLLWTPGPAETAPQSPVAAGLSTAAGFAGPKQIRTVLAKVNTSGTTLTSASVAARIDNPAARLVCGFSLSFEPKIPQVFTNYASAAWTATAMRPGGGTGREAKLHNIFSAQALPQLYEIASAVRSVLIEATVTIPLTAGAVAIEGEWVLVSEWEPGMPMCLDEIAALYARCNAQVVLAPASALAP